MKGLINALKILTKRKLPKSEISKLNRDIIIGESQSENTITREYDSQGRLIRKEIKHPLGPFNLEGYREEAFVYQPAGRFIGEREDRFENVSYLVKFNSNEFFLMEQDPVKGTRMSDINSETGRIYARRVD